MRAVVCEALAGISSRHPERPPQPRPRGGEVRIKVEDASPISQTF
jgi:hypothetical protein